MLITKNVFFYSGNFPFFYLQLVVIWCSEFFYIYVVNIDEVWFLIYIEASIKDFGLINKETFLQNLNHMCLLQAAY